MPSKEVAKCENYQGEHGHWVALDGVEWCSAVGRVYQKSDLSGKDQSEPSKKGTGTTS